MTSGTTIGESRAESQGVVDIASAVFIERSLTLTTKKLVLKIDSNGGEPVQLTNEYAAYPSVSPDGKLIACFHFPKMSHEARMSTDDMKTVAELALAPGFWISRSIQWDADNATLFYASESEGKLKLYRQSIYSSPPQEVSTLKGEDEFEFAFSPNHKQLAYISSKWNHDAVLVAGLK